MQVLHIQYPVGPCLKTSWPAVQQYWHILCLGFTRPRDLNLCSFNHNMTLGVTLAMHNLHNKGKCSFVPPVMNHDGMHWWAAINGLCHLELLLQLDMATPRAVADAYVFSTTFSLVVTLTSKSNRFVSVCKSTKTANLIKFHWVVY